MTAASGSLLGAMAAARDVAMDERTALLPLPAYKGAQARYRPLTKRESTLIDAELTKAVGGLIVAEVQTNGNGNGKRTAKPAPDESDIHRQILVDACVGIVFGGETIPDDEHGPVRFGMSLAAALGLPEGTAARDVLSHCYGTQEALIPDHARSLHAWTKQVVGDVETELIEG